jgi:hypothetical protein
MSVARDQKWKEFMSNPITPEKSMDLKNKLTASTNDLVFNKTTDFT